MGKHLFSGAQFWYSSKVNVRAIMMGSTLPCTAHSVMILLSILRWLWDSANLDFRFPVFMLCSWHTVM